MNKKIILKGFNLNKNNATKRPKKLNRNIQCPCGSGKKIKRCHLYLYNFTRDRTESL